MSILKKLKDTFLPSEKTSAARRVKAFGSESKAKAGAIIVGGAAVAAVAGAAVGLAGGAAKAATSPVIAKAATSIGQSAVNVAKNNPIKTAIIAPIVGLQLATNPKARKAGGELVSQTGGFIVDAGTAKDLTDLKNAFVNNPYGAAASALLVAGTTTGAYYAGKGLNEFMSSKDNVTQIIGENISKSKNENVIPTNSIIPENASLPKEKIQALAPSETPLTPQTIPLGREVSSTTRKNLSSKYKKQVAPTQMIRLTINNQNRNAKFIKIAR
jgi:hypothetical protein